MSKELHIQLEPLTEEERQFLLRRLKVEKKTYRRVVAILLVLAMGMSYAVGWHRVEPYEEDIFSWKRFAAGFLLLSGILTLASYASYNLSTRFLARDLKKNVKCVEQTIIVEKKYMAINNTYHFYLDSPHKYSIEVGESDYQKFELGDEVNIEYTPFSKIYFYYF